MLSHIARDECLSKILKRGEAEGTHASLFGLSFCEELVLEREAVGDAEFLGLVCARGVDARGAGLQLVSVRFQGARLVSDLLDLQVGSVFACFFCLRCDSATLCLTFARMRVLVRLLVSVRTGA